jgi:hypothetical protein
LGEKKLEGENLIHIFISQGVNAADISNIFQPISYISHQENHGNAFSPGYRLTKVLACPENGII